MSSPATIASSLEVLCRQGRVWRGRHVGQDGEQRLPTGHPELDMALGGGLARGALAEILSRRDSGLSLLLPLLARLSAEPRWLGWLAPPHLPYAPALAQAGIALDRVLLIHSRDTKQDLWALEQTLASGHCSAVLAWPARIAPAQLRRLQLSAEQGGALGVLFRPPDALAQSSPAGFRLGVAPSPRGLKVQVHKRRGGWGSAREIFIPRAISSEGDLRGPHGSPPGGGRQPAG